MNITILYIEITQNDKTLIKSKKFCRNITKILHTFLQMILTWTIIYGVDCRSSLPPNLNNNKSYFYFGYSLKIHAVLYFFVKALIEPGTVKPSFPRRTCKRDITLLSQLTARSKTECHYARFNLNLLSILSLLR